MKERYTFDDLLKIMDELRVGCPWDQKQTHESIRGNLLEEAYEAVEALDTKDKADFCDELGDVLLQVVFHAKIASETNTFNINDVITNICQKLIVRHPHIYGDVVAETSEEVLKNWDAIKREQRNQNTLSDELRGVSRALPALMRCEKIQKKAERESCYNHSAEESAAIIQGKLGEILSNSDNLESKMGEILFEITNISRIFKINAEGCLTSELERFIMNL